MATVDVMFVSPAERAELLRGLVMDKLSTAAREILAVVDRTVAGFEEEASGLRQLIDLQRRQLELLLQPRVTLFRIDEEFPARQPAAGGRTEEHKSEPDEEIPVCEPTAGGRTEEHKSEPKEPVCEEEDAGGEELPEDEEQPTRISSTRTSDDDDVEDFSGHAEEEEGGDEAAQSYSLHQDDLKNRDHQKPKARGRSVKMKCNRRHPLNLRVGLLKDSHSNVLKRNELMCPVKDLTCPRRLQESNFLDLLRSTFPQLTGGFDVFTVDSNRRLMPLKLQTLTPEEIQRSIRSTGKGRSALYIRVKRAKTTSPEQLLPPETTDENTANTSRDDNRTRASSDHSPADKVESNKADHQSGNSRRQQQKKVVEDGQQRGISQDSSGSSARAAAESEGEHGDDDVEVQEEDDEEFPVCQSTAGGRTEEHKSEPKEPVCEEEDAGGEELPEDEEQPTRISSTRTSDDDDVEDFSGHAEEEEGGDEAAQSYGLHQDDLKNRDHQTPKARGRSVKMKCNRRHPLNLRVGLLKDSHSNVLKRNVVMCPVKDLTCPRRLQESNFLDLLRSTFPQLTEGFDVFTVDSNRRLKPLKLQTLTPEEIQRSIRSTGKGRSALYIRVKRAKMTSPEQLLPPETTDENTANTSRDDNRTCASSDHSPVDKVESNKADHQSGNSRRQQQEKVVEDGQQRGISQDSSGSSARAAAESEGEHGDDDVEVQEEDDGDDEWKPDKNDKELSEDQAEPRPSKTTRKRRVKHPGDKTKGRKQKEASTENSDAALSCKVCHALHRSKNMLIKHAWTHIDDPERLCGACGERSESADELKSHLQTHRKTHSCDICGKSFLTAASRRSHAAVHTGERPYKCEICYKTYTCSSGLRNHLWQHVNEKPYKCGVCDQSFAFKQQLRIHSSSHSGKKPYCCNVCGKSFADFRALSRHKLLHVGIKYFCCQVCGKRFRTSFRLKLHEKIHLERDKAFLCDICCKMFYTRGELKVHLRTHTKVTITCTECGKGLSSKESLNSHMIVHTAERPHQCSECGLRFKRMSNLTEHMKIHTAVKSYVCGVCGKACARKTYLTVHMRTHSGERPYECTVCERAFTQSHCLKTHMKSHQEVEKAAEDGLKSS